MQESMSSSSLSSDNNVDVWGLLLTLIEQLSLTTNQQKDALVSTTTRQLHEACQPAVVMNVLAPRLFIPDDPSGQEVFSLLSSDDALTIVTFLASFDAATYLKPASRAVKEEALRLSTTTCDEPMYVSDRLLTVLVTQLSGSDVEVSENATATMLACCKRLGPPMADRAIQMIVTTSWQRVMNPPNANINRSLATTVSVRCASAVVDIICLGGDAAMESAQSTGATTLLLQMMTDANDPLLQMSTFDLIETLAKTLPMHALRAKWLFSNSIVDPLLQMVGAGRTNAGGNDMMDDNFDEKEADPILGGPALRLLSFLCKLAQHDTSLVDWSGSDGGGGRHLLVGFHHALHKFADGSTGELDRLAMVDAISSFASASPEALELVLNDPILREAWLSFSSVAQPKLKSAIVTSMAMVMNPPAEKDSNGDSTIVSYIPSTPLAMKLYSCLGLANLHREDATTELVLNLAKSPLPELRLGAYTLLTAVAQRGTGAQVLLSYHGYEMLEFLLSRDVENTKVGKEAKYAIVQAIMASEARGLLAEPIVRKLELFLKQGPYYVPTQNFELMTE